MEINMEESTQGTEETQQEKQVELDYAPQHCEVYPYENRNESNVSAEFVFAAVNGFFAEGSWKDLEGEELYNHVNKFQEVLDMMSNFVFTN